MKYKERTFFNAKLEPKTTVLHGGGQDPAGFRDYCHALGKSRMPAIYMSYVHLTGDAQQVSSWGKRLQDEMAAIRIDSIMPQIGLNMTDGTENGGGREAEVAQGLKDDNIQALCAALKALNKPVFIRIGYEFEGGWNGYKPDTYKAAFIRITRALRRHKIEAATVWCSAGGSAGDVPLDTVMQYHPGDEWVDWWGIDLFSANEILSKKTLEFCVHAARHQKPVMIGESTARYVGVLDGEISWGKWFAPYFELIRTRPEIKAFCYINWEWKYWSGISGFKWDEWGDCRIERNEHVAEQYRKEMDLPLYQHATTLSSPQRGRGSR